MQHILVTGCAGFIGSHLCEQLLASGLRVTGIDNFDPFYDEAIKRRNLKDFKEHNHFTFRELDFKEKRALTNLPGDFDVVIHLAAKAGVLPSLKDPNGYIMNNIVGTNNILELMRERGTKKMLFASSSSIYGNNKSTPFREDDRVDETISPYAFTKKSCEVMNYNYFHLYNIDILNLRLFTVYGPRQRPDLAIHKFVKLIDADQPITMYGDGSSSRDYTFVGDTVKGFMQALEYINNNQKVFDIYNLGNNQPVQLKELIYTIYELMGKEPNVQQIEMQPGDVDITYADIGKAGKAFGYQPEVDIKTGLSRFIDWFYEQKEA